METLTPHALEPAVSGPPPRRAFLPPGLLALVTLALLLFVLLLAGGTSALLQSAKLGWVEVTGSVVPARITAIDTLAGASPGQPAVQIRVHYAYGYAPYFPHEGAGTLPLSNVVAMPRSTPFTALGPPPAPAAPALQFHVGDTLTLRQTRWLGREVVLPWPPHPGGKIAFLALCGGLIVAVSLNLIQRLWKWTRRRVRLLGHGIATVGTITHKHSQAEDPAHYFVSYGYGDAQTPPLSFEHEEQVTADQWKCLQVGQPVTVLYDPARPAVAGLYTLLRGR